VLLKSCNEKGDESHLPERPFGCFAQMTPVPFFLAGHIQHDTRLIKFEIRIPKQIPNDEIQMTETQSSIQASRLTSHAGVAVIRLKHLSFGF
jgi:hypothetical protein